MGRPQNKAELIYAANTNNMIIGSSLMRFPVILTTSFVSLLQRRSRELYMYYLIWNNWQ